MRPPRRFAVERYHLAVRHAHDRLHPTQKARPELARVQPREDLAKCVMRRNAIGQPQELLNPGAFGFPKRDHFHPAVCAAEDGREGDHDDIQQQVLLGVIRTRVGQLGKMCLDRSNR
jgi:hypothetical protein